MANWYSSGFEDEDADKDVSDFLSGCDDLRADLDDLPEEADDFVTSVRSKIEGMSSWVRENQRVTPKMIAALENMAEGAAKWQRER